MRQHNYKSDASINSNKFGFSRFSNGSTSEQSKRQSNHQIATTSASKSSNIAKLVGKKVVCINSGISPLSKTIKKRLFLPPVPKKEWKDYLLDFSVDFNDEHDFFSVHDEFILLKTRKESKKYLNITDNTNSPTTTVISSSDRSISDHNIFSINNDQTIDDFNSNDSEKDDNRKERVEKKILALSNLEISREEEEWEYKKTNLDELISELEKDFPIEKFGNFQREFLNLLYLDRFANNQKECQQFITSKGFFYL
jgi:hypothetical protein